jgi:hypothetical protein
MNDFFASDDFGCGLTDFSPLNLNFNFKKREPLGKVLFLHGWCSDGSTKTLSLIVWGYDVCKPQLSNWSFKSAVESAEEAYEAFQPDLIIGASRGGAVAMNMKSGDTPMILMSPAWKMFGDAQSINKPNTIIIHSKLDTMVGYGDSVSLLENSVPGVRLMTAGEDHRLNCKAAKEALDEAIQTFIPLPADYWTNQINQTGFTYLPTLD